MADISISYLYSLKDKFSGKIKDINRNLSKNKKLIKSMNADIKKFSGSFAKVALVGTAAFTGMTIAAARFESGMNKVKTLMNAEEIKKFGPIIEESAKKGFRLGKSMADVQDALFETISSLGATENAIEAFDQSLFLAIGGQAELAASVKGVTKLINVYGKETTDAKRVTIALFRAQAIGSTDVQKLASNIGKVAGTAKLAGIDIEELAATLGVLTLGLPSTEEAAVALVAIIKALAKPGPQAIAIFEELGISSGLAAIKSKGLGAILLQISEAMKTKRGPELILRAIPEITALKGIAAITEETLVTMNDAMVQMGVDARTGSGLMEAFKLVMGETTQKALGLKGRLTILAVTFGTLLLPTTKKVIDSLTKMLEKWIALSPATKKIILIVGAAVVGFTGLLTVIAGITAIAPALVAAFSIISGAVLLVSGPITGIIVGITALVTLGAILVKKWKPAKDLFEKIVEILKKIKGFAFKSLGKLVFAPTKESRIKNIDNPRLSNDLISETAQVQRGSFDANININAPKGTVKSIESKEKKTPLINLGLNLQES